MADPGRVSCALHPANLLARGVLLDTPSGFFDGETGDRRVAEAVAKALKPGGALGHGKIATAVWKTLKKD